MINRLNGFISELEKLALKLEGAPNTVFARGENQEANIGRQRLSSADKSGIINRAQKRVPDFSENISALLCELSIFWALVIKQTIIILNVKSAFFIN